MNTPLDHEPEDLRWAEYVLGVLDANARGRSGALATAPAAAGEDISDAMPADPVRARIQNQLGWSQPTRHARPVEPERGAGGTGFRCGADSPWARPPSPPFASSR